jgi:hypothetical protein
MNIRSSRNGRAGKPAPHRGFLAQCESDRKPQSAALVDGIVNGERVLIAKPRKASERSVEIRVRVALAAAGVLVMKHFVPPCFDCGAKPNHTVGLGVGASDLVCVVPPYGRFLGIEMKAPGKRSTTSDEQKHWLAVVRRFGGITGVATSVEEAMALLEEARRAP